MVTVLLFALTLLAAVLVSELAGRSVLSAAVLFLVVGFASGEGMLGFVALDATDPVVSRFAELALFTILFTDGMRLKVSELREVWRLPGRALLIGLPLTLVTTALFARLVAGVPWPDAWLIGAALSPTDPVFAAALIGREGVPLRLRRLLNVESGLNDGLALPIVLGLLAVQGASEASFADALAESVTGAATGVAIAWGAVRLERLTIFEVADSYAGLGVFAIGLLVLAVTSLTHGNEFLGAFAAGVTLATIAPNVRQAFEPLGEALAELLKLGALLLFGALISPSLLASLPATAYVFAALVLLVARPLAIVVSLAGTGLSSRETLAAAWFGPKGFASVFFGLLILKSGLDNGADLFHLLAVAVAASMIAHSSTDVLVARWFESRAPETAAAGDG